MSEEGSNNEGYDDIDYYEEENANLPQQFSSMKWPNPKLKDNRPVGPDKALVWFLEFYKNSLIEDHNIDVKALEKKSR